MVIIKSCFKITGSSSMSLYSSEEHTVLTGMLLILKTSINPYYIRGKILFCINSSEFILFFLVFYFGVHVLVLEMSNLIV